MTATTIRRFLPTVALAAALASGATVRGQTYTWTAYSSGNWSPSANWAGGNVPVSGTTAKLVFNSILDVGYVATNDIATPFVTNSITINDASSTSSPFGIQLVGPIQMDGATPGIVNNGPSDLYLGPISGTASTLTLNAGTTISGANAGQIRITDQVSGSGPLTLNRPATSFANGFTLFFNGANNFSGGLTLQAGNLTLGNALGINSTPANIGTGALTIATTGSGITGSGDLRSNAGNTAPVILTVPVSINSGATLNQIRGSLIVLGTPVTGGGGVNTGSVVYAPTAGLTLERANTYSGTTNAINTTLTIRGTTGALAGTSQIEMFRNSTLILDSNSINADTGNAAGNQTSQDRIPDATPVIFHNAAFNMIANASASTTETVGTLTADGWNLVNLTPQSATGVALTIGNLARSNRGTLDVRGTGLGGAASGTANSANLFLTQVNGAAPTASQVGGGGVAGSQNISILPFMTGGGTPGSAGNTFVTYDTNGLRPLNTSAEFAAAPAVGSNNNVRTTVPLVVAGQPSSANSMIVGAASAGLWGFGGTSGQLNVASGAMLTTTATSYLNVGALNFGGAEAVLIANGTTVVNSAIVNNAGLTYGGNARTALVSPSSTITGPLTINSGQLTINNQAQLGGTSSINFNGGALNVSNLGTGSTDVLSTPINVGAAGGTINVIPVGASTSSNSQTLTLTGALSGAGPLLINGGGAIVSQFLPQTGGGTVILAGDASNFTGMAVMNAGVTQIDSDARLGSNPTMVLSSAANTSQPATLHVTATTSTNKNLFVGALGFIQVDGGATYTLNGAVQSIVTSSSLRKFGPGNLVLTATNGLGNSVFVGSQAMTGNINLTSAAAGSFSGIGGTLTLRDQGALLSLNTAGVTIAPGSSLVLDNSGSANLTNRLNNIPVNVAGGTFVLVGSPTAPSSEIVGAMTLLANTGSIVEVDPGATQTAAIYFSGPTTGGFVRANNTGNGSTVTLRAPGLGGTTGGTGQINFIQNGGSSTGPALVGGGGAAGSQTVSILPYAFGEDSGSGSIGLTTVDGVAASASLPQYYRTRLLTAGEYTNGSPDAGTSTSNIRLTVGTVSNAGPSINSLFVDTGGALNITGAGVTINSGTVMMAGGTSIVGSSLVAPQDGDLALYVGPGTATLGSDVLLASSGLPPIGRTLAKTGPGTLVLTTSLSMGNPAGTVAVQRGVFQLGAGGGIPALANVSVDAGATFDLNSPGTTVSIQRLVGLGTVLLGSSTASNLQINVPSTAPSTAVFGGTISGAGSIEKIGPGTFEFGPTANFTGPITLTAGTLQFDDLNGFAPLVPTVAGAAITAADGTTITFSNVQNFQRPVNATVGNTNGTVTFNGNQGSTTNVSSLFTLTSGKTLAITTSTGGLYNFSGSIIGAGNVTWNAGSDIISGVNTYVGTTTISGAAVMGIASDMPFGNGAVTISAAASLFAAGANHTVPNAIALNSDITIGTSNPIYQGYNLTLGGPVTINATRTITTNAAGVFTLTNVSGATFGLIKAGGGTLALAGSSNTYSGTTAVNAGTLLVNGMVSTSTGAGTLVTVASGAFLGGTGSLNRDVTVYAGGTVSANGGTFTIGSLAGAGTVNNNATTGGTLAVGSNNASTSYSGLIADGWTGPLTFSKIGNGTLTLTNTPNTYSGGTTVSGGTLSVAADTSLGTGPATATPFGTLLYTANTTTTRSFPLSGGTIAASTGATVVFNGSQVSGGYLAGPGAFATGATGAQFAGVTTKANALLTSNSGSDQFINFTNGGAMTVAAGIPTGTPVSVNGFTNAGSGSLTIGAASFVSTADFQTYGTLTINPATITENFSQTTKMTNVGTSQLYFNGGSTTFLGTPATAVFPSSSPQAGNPTFVAGIDLNGKNAVVAGGLFVNNGYVDDSTNNFAGTSTVVADFGSLVKGSGFFQNSVITQNGGRFQAGNSPGAVSFGQFVVGPGGVSNYVFSIDDANGAAGPRPDSQGHVSGWGLVKSVQQAIGARTTSGDFTWTATPAAPLSFAVDTLLDPTTVGVDVPGPMADFDPTKAYSWPAFEWTGNYSGPTDKTILAASTAFDTSGFQNPLAGVFGWSFDQAGRTLSLTYTPSAVPEPGTLALTAVTSLTCGWVFRRRRATLVRSDSE
jgi:autotransporter-associated beta strand protein